MNSNLKKKIGTFIHSIIVVLLIIALIFAIYILLVKTQKENHQNVNYCYSSDPTPSKRFATKSLYDFDRITNSSQTFLKSNCKLLQLWTVIRHGVRLPEAPEVPILTIDIPQIQKEILENYEKKMLETRLCEADFNNLKNWKLNSMVNSETAYRLSESGGQQMAHLGDRFRIEYSSLFESAYNEEDYIIYTNYEYCIAQSRDIFLDRLFNSTNKFKRDNSNSILKWFNDNIKDRIFSSVELNKLETVPIVQNMILDISEKLGYHENPLNWTAVKLMYDMCRYDNAWNIDDLSPWCAVFTPEQKNIMEYEEDLSCFYEYGYGNDDAIEMGCPSIKSMLYYFMKVANNELNQPKAILIFTHRGTIETLLVCLNAHKDSYFLTADNYEQARDRKWKTTDDCPFTAQISMEFYSCGNTEKYVQFNLNEEPLEIDYPGCVDGLCPWQSVFNNLKPIADNCVID